MAISSSPPRKTRSVLAGHRSSLLFSTALTTNNGEMMYEKVSYEKILGPGEVEGTLPAPPQEIRERMRLPAKYRFDCLHADRASEYTREYRDISIKYVKGFPVYAPSGIGPVFVGPARTGTSKSAAATLNELMMRYGPPHSDMHANWLSGFWVLRMILDAKDLGQKDYYTSLRTQMFQSDVVVVDDLLAAVEHVGGRAFIQTVYAYRWDHNLPTITTITTPEAGADVGKLVENAFGKQFKDKLALHTGRGLISERGSL